MPSNHTPAPDHGEPQVLIVYGQEAELIYASRRISGVDPEQFVESPETCLRLLRQLAGKFAHSLMEVALLKASDDAYQTLIDRSDDGAQTTV